MGLLDFIKDIGNKLFNRDVIKDANLIYPGQKIRIPLD